MDHTAHNKIVSFIWSIADDCLRDVFVRGKYRDVILPMFILRRLDCGLEPSKEANLLEHRFQRRDAEMTDLGPHCSGVLHDLTEMCVFYEIIFSPQRAQNPG
ncbi:type I restriction-modification system subunit M N-terminal domain-containing protein [Zoogloea oryzae]|jgi:type I restriction enzyme M protein|uniref:N6 adenine-specific DNA methyltransferase N-terminal domain-containing protein n=1 Tax=Zoogloea oryzae TaxID=310767 RepID=A0ABQ6F730_9RHOO|nr:type I restriction-modification system subunit M N-terminal domain-containing protein [Zoogloea oryzae]GLT21355.1 hypothetical protein GCM10007933_08070 [Zoogloea oryzae]